MEPGRHNHLSLQLAKYWLWDLGLRYCQTLGLIYQLVLVITFVEHQDLSLQSLKCWPVAIDSAKDAPPEHRLTKATGSSSLGRPINIPLCYLLGPEARGGDRTGNHLVTFSDQPRAGTL